jgi:hypothetical protein
MDRLDELERRLVAELDDRIQTAEKEAAAAIERLKALRNKRSAIVGDAKGVTPTGLAVIAANNTLQRLRRTGASKGEISAVERELAGLRAKLTQEKEARKGGRS